MIRTLPLALVLLAACDDGLSTPMADPPDMSLPQVAGCPAPDTGTLLGLDVAALDTLDLPAGTRVFRTGDPVTADFSPDRLNLEVGPDNLIVAVTCG
jgi:hypothetical protein